MAKQGVSSNKPLNPMYSGNMPNPNQVPYYQNTGSIMYGSGSNYTNNIMDRNNSPYKPQMGQGSSPANQIKQTQNFVNKGTSSSNNGGGGSNSGDNWGGGTSVQQPAWSGPNWTPKLYTADELANIWGMNISQDYYKGMLDEASLKYFNQLETQRRRSEQQAYDFLAENYEIQKNQVKQNRQEALKNGMSSGQLAAQELSTLMSSQEAGGQIATDVLQTDYDLAQQQATTLEENMLLAYQMAEEARANLANLSSQIYSVDTQRYAADAAGNAQIGAANIGAYGQIASANASANATKYAANRSAEVQEALSNPQYYTNYFNAMSDAQYKNQQKYYTNRN